MRWDDKEFSAATIVCFREQECAAQLDVKMSINGGRGEKRKKRKKRKKEEKKKGKKRKKEEKRGEKKSQDRKDLLIRYPKHGGGNCAQCLGTPGGTAISRLRESK